MLYALRELVLVLLDAFREAREAADLKARLNVWWREVSNPEREHLPIYGRIAVFNQRQLVALSIAQRQGKVTNGDLQERFAYHPETLRQDLARLCELGYLAKHGNTRNTFYVLEA